MNYLNSCIAHTARLCNSIPLWVSQQRQNTWNDDEIQRCCDLVSLLHNAVGANVFFCNTAGATVLFQCIWCKCFFATQWVQFFLQHIWYKCFLQRSECKLKWQHFLTGVFWSSVEFNFHFTPVNTSELLPAGAECWNKYYYYYHYHHHCYHYS